MAVRASEDGHRSIAVEVEVPGTPDEVWEAVATGRGISAWFVPTTVDERVGGKTVSSFGPGMDSVAEVSVWEPPHRFAAQAEGGGPGLVTTEWQVEPRGGETCTVRVIHRWRADTDEWDGEFVMHAFGWAAAYLQLLRLYLTHFRGLTSAAIQLSAMTGMSAPEAWRALMGGLKIDKETGRVDSAPGAPELRGTVERVKIEDPDLLRIAESAPHLVAARAAMEGEEPNLLLRLERPATDLSQLMVMPMGGQTLVTVRFYFYGEQVVEVTQAAEREWQAWLGERFAR